MSLVCLSLLLFALSQSVAGIDCLYAPDSSNKIANCSSCYRIQHMVVDENYTAINTQFVKSGCSDEFHGGPGILEWSCNNLITKKGSDQLRIFRDPDTDDNRGLFLKRCCYSDNCNTPFTFPHFRLYVKKPRVERSDQIPAFFMIVLLIGASLIRPVYLLYFSADEKERKNIKKQAKKDHSPDQMQLRAIPMPVEAKAKALTGILRIEELLETMVELGELIEDQEKNGGRVVGGGKLKYSGYRRGKTGKDDKDGKTASVSGANVAVSVNKRSGDEIDEATAKGTTEQDKAPKGGSKEPADLNKGIGETEKKEEEKGGSKKKDKRVKIGAEDKTEQTTPIESSDFDPYAPAPAAPKKKSQRSNRSGSEEDDSRKIREMDIQEIHHVKKDHRVDIRGRLWKTARVAHQTPEAIRKRPSVFEPLLLRLIEHGPYIFPFKELELMELFDKAKDAFSEDRHLVRLQSPVFVVGDLRGQYPDLMRVLQLGGWPPKSTFLFLGGILDESTPGSLECLALISALKIAAPDKIFVIRGVAEALPFTPDRFDIKSAEAIGGTMTRLCEHLPVAALIDKSILCVHSGIAPQLRSTDHLPEVVRPCAFDAMPPLQRKLIFSDPSDNVRMYRSKAAPDIGDLYGAQAVKRVCRQLKVDFIIRGRSVLKDGAAGFFDSQLISLWTAPAYAEGQSSGAVLEIKKEGITCHFIPAMSKDEEDRIATAAELEKPSKPALKAKKKKSTRRKVTPKATDEDSKLLDDFTANSGKTSAADVVKTDSDLDSKVVTDTEEKTAEEVTEKASMEVEKSEKSEKKTQLFSVIRTRTPRFNEFAFNKEATATGRELKSKAELKSKTELKSVKTELQSVQSSRKKSEH